MKRELKIRNKKLDITTLDAVVAIKEGQRPGRALRAATPVFLGDLVAPPGEGATTFLQARWRFTSMQEGLKMAARSGTTFPGVDAVREVSLTASGRVVVTGDVLTVKLYEGLDEQQATEQLTRDRVNIVRRLPFQNAYEVRTSGVESALDAAVRLSSLTPYEFAEPAFEEAIGHRWLPTDPDFVRQWQWLNSGGGGGTPNADARIIEAWNLTRGLRVDGSAVRVAVIDNGIDVTHPDLSSAITHGGYFDGDGTGSTSFVPYVQGAPFPDDDHGTFCAGMAVARANNGRGGCGAAPESSFIPVACMNDQIGTQTTLARALVYAALPSSEEPNRSNDEGADVLACSLGPNGPDWEMTSVLELAINRVVSEGRGGKGTPLFWAVSNGHFEVARDEVVSHPSVIKVGRSNRLDLHDGSAFGPALDFLAPGVAVFSTRSGGDYGANTGTSFAAPLAAGVGALILAQHPQLTWDQVRDRIRTGCDRVGPFPYAAGRNDEYGFGRINAFRSI